MFRKKTNVSKANEKPMIDWVRNDYDPISGALIDELIMKGETFIVYIDSKCNIMWSTDGHKKFGDEFGEVCNAYRKLEYLVDRVFVWKSTRRHLKALIAEGPARSLDGDDKDDSIAALKFAENLVLKQATNVLKAQYIYATVLTTCLIILAFGLLWFFREKMLMAIGSNAFVILVSSLAGGIGAFFSTFARSLKFTGDPWIQPAVYRLDGFLRIFYGLIAGFAITLALKANIVLSFTNATEEKGLPLLCFLAMIGGASETLIPSIIKKIEDQNSASK